MLYNALLFFVIVAIAIKEAQETGVMHTLSFNHHRSSLHSCVITYISTYVVFRKCHLLHIISIIQS